MLEIAVAIIVVGVLLWAVNTYVPMEARLKQLLNVVVILLVVLWVLRQIWPSLRGFVPP